MKVKQSARRRERQHASAARRPSTMASLSRDTEDGGEGGGLSSAAVGERLKNDKLKISQLSLKALQLFAHESTSYGAMVREYLSDPSAQARTPPRDLLGDILIANNAPLTEKVLTQVDDIYTLEASPGLCKIQVRNIDRSSLGDDAVFYSGAHGTSLIVFKGDIRCLRVDAMVNAANEDGLGCFQPKHMCIDNVLHRAAGPRLRESCRQGLATREEGIKIKTGTSPLVTPGYHLPCKKVLHVTGPCLRNRGLPTALESEQLRSCYRLCLEAAKKHSMKSIAFCCISTGLFGYPQDLAAKAALETVINWVSLEENRQVLESIIFVTYLDSDNIIYRRLMHGR